MSTCSTCSASEAHPSPFSIENKNKQSVLVSWFLPGLLFLVLGLFHTTDVTGN